MSAQKRQKLSAGDARLVCQLCEKSYERADHLARHLDSHRNERGFKCSACPRAFNRRDLLLRHQASHSQRSEKGTSNSDRASERAIRACDTCVLSKLKCGRGRPCKRCQDRGIECTTQSPGRHQAVHSPTRSSSEDRRPSGDGLRTPESSASHADNSSATVGLDEQGIAASVAIQPPVMELFPDPITWPASDFNAGAFDFPAYFEHIMDPDPTFGLSDAVQMPPALSTLMPTRDWNGDSDIFGLEFTPTVDEAIGTIDFAFSRPELQTPLDHSEDPSKGAQGAEKRHKIYQQSPWLWRPEVRSNAFSEDNNIPLDDQTVDSATPPQPSRLLDLAAQVQLPHHVRDNIFQLILKVANSHLNIPSFPSTKTLDTLLKVGIARKSEHDKWFHPFTFSVEKARPELLVALIAAGCVTFNIPNISKTGLVLFEVAQMALSRLFEDDNHVIQDLQYLQASMSWLDTCAFCGFTRKMEIAEANLQPLVTALRRFAKFDRGSYPYVDVKAEDEGTTLEAKWQRWVEQESYKRLVHHVFRHDMYMTVTKVRNPLVSYAEMSLPLPARPELWYAPTAEAWKALYLSNGTGDQRRTISLRELLADKALVKFLPESIDRDLADQAYVHGLAALSWDCSQHSKLLNTVEPSANPLGRLWLQSRYEGLYDTLQNFSPGTYSHSPNLKILQEFLMMSLHVSPETITAFAGKNGEEEAHRAYKELQAWALTKPARHAAWHAGQVVRATLRVPHHSLRGAESLMIHHTVMVIWAYSMLQRDAARRAGLATPVNNVTNLQSSFLDAVAVDQIVALDGESNAKTHAFITSGTGRPFLRLDETSWITQSNEKSRMCDLRYPQQVLLAGVRVLESRYPGEARDILPPMVKSLCDLMDLLASLR